MFQPSPFGKYLCEYGAEMLHPLFCLAAVGTCLSAGPSDWTSINSFQRATCPAPSLLSHQSIVTLQIVSQGALWAVGDEEEGGSDKSVALNCYRFSGLNLFFFFFLFREVKSPGWGPEVSRCCYSKWYLSQSIIFFSSYCPVCGKLKSEASWESLPHLSVDCQLIVSDAFFTMRKPVQLWIQFFPHVSGDMWNSWAQSQH